MTVYETRCRQDEWIPLCEVKDHGLWVDGEGDFWVTFAGDGMRCLLLAEEAMSDSRCADFNFRVRRVSRVRITELPAEGQ